MHCGRGGAGLPLAPAPATQVCALRLAGWPPPLQAAAALALLLGHAACPVTVPRVTRAWSSVSQSFRCSYLKWREAVTVAVRLAMTSMPHCWATVLHPLRAPSWETVRPGPLALLPPQLVLWALLAHGSKALLECMLALARPVRLAVHIPAQLLQAS